MLGVFVWTAGDAIGILSLAIAALLIAGVIIVEAVKSTIGRVKKNLRRVRKNGEYQYQGRS